MTTSDYTQRVVKRLRESGFKKKRASGMAEVLADVVTEAQECSTLEAIEILSRDIEQKFSAGETARQADQNRFEERFNHLESLLKQVLSGQAELLKAEAETQRLMQQTNG